MAAAQPLHGYSYQDLNAIYNAVFDDLDALDPEDREFLQQGRGPGLDVRPTMPQTAEETHAAGVGALFGTQKNFLLLNPISSQWTCQNIKASPIFVPIFYLLGMIGYALALPIRIMIFVVSFFKMIGTFFVTLFTGQFGLLAPRMKLRTLVFLGATGELVSGAIGVACPPLAYKFDEWIQSNKIIHKWYSGSYLSFWSYEADGRQVADGDVGIGGETISVGNENRMQNLKIELSEYDAYFAQAKKDITGYIKEDEIDGMMPLALQQFCQHGFLHAIAEGKPLDIFKEKALEKVAEHEKEKKEKELNDELKKFEDIWNAIIDNKETASRLAGLPLIGRFFQDEDEADGSATKISKEELLEAIKKELILHEEDRALEKGAETRKLLKKDLRKYRKIPVQLEGKRETANAAIQQMAKAIRDFSDNLCKTNREVEITVMKAAYQA